MARGENPKPLTVSIQTTALGFYSASTAPVQQPKVPTCHEGESPLACGCICIVGSR